MRVLTTDEIEMVSGNLGIVEAAGTGAAIGGTIGVIGGYLSGGIPLAVSAGGGLSVMGGAFGVAFFAGFTLGTFAREFVRGIVLQ